MVTFYFLKLVIKDVVKYYHFNWYVLKVGIMEEGRIMKESWMNEYMKEGSMKIF